jgi:hypothetical protein
MHLPGQANAHAQLRYRGEDPGLGVSEVSLQERYDCSMRLEYV